MDSMERTLKGTSPLFTVPLIPFLLRNERHCFLPTKLGRPLTFGSEQFSIVRLLDYSMENRANTQDELGLEVIVITLPVNG